MHFYSANMRLTKAQLLAIMVLCAAIIALALVVSMYVERSHDWTYGVTADKCTECHADIEAEILSMPAGYPHRALYVANNCSVCHINSTAGYVAGTNHSGTVPECTWCHNASEPERDGDGVYGIQNLTATTEAHFPMWDDALGSDHDPGKNEPCLACHTRTKVNVIFNRPQWYNYSIDQSWSITGVTSGATYEGGNYTLSFVNPDLGKHYWMPYKDCGANGGCHQDVQFSRMGGISGGHQANIANAHEASGNCTVCHWGEDPSKDYHAARVVNCTYAGCHTPVSANMTTIFGQIDTVLDKNQRGDLCWGCHSGYDWVDAGTGISILVETERNYNVTVWNGTVTETVYTDPGNNCSACHNDSLANVAYIPEWSGKHVEHSTVGFYEYGLDGTSGCQNCHDEPWLPHDSEHEIMITYNDYLPTMGADNNFCDLACHYSVLDWRPSHVVKTDFRATTQTIMSDASANFDANGGKHKVPGALAPLWFGGNCAEDCHTEHLTIPTCTDCHDGSMALDHNLPTGAGSPWAAPGMYNVDTIYVNRSAEEVISSGVSWKGTYVWTQMDDDVRRVIREKNLGGSSSEEVFASGPQAAAGVFAANYQNLAGGSPANTDDPLNDGLEQTMDELGGAGSSTSTYVTSAGSSESINTGTAAGGALSDTETDNNNAGHRDIGEQDSGQTHTAGSELVGPIYASSTNTYTATQGDDVSYHTLTEDLEYDWIDAETITSGTGVGAFVAADLQDSGANYRQVQELDVLGGLTNDWGWPTATDVNSGTLSFSSVSFLGDIDEAQDAESTPPFASDGQTGTITEADTSGGGGDTNLIWDNFTGPALGAWTTNAVNGFGGPGSGTSIAYNGAATNDGGTGCMEVQGVGKNGATTYTLTYDIADIAAGTGYIVSFNESLSTNPDDARNTAVEVEGPAGTWTQVGAAITDATVHGWTQWSFEGVAGASGVLAVRLSETFWDHPNSNGYTSEHRYDNFRVVERGVGGPNYEFDVVVELTSVVDPATQTASNLYVNVSSYTEIDQLVWYVWDNGINDWALQSTLQVGTNTIDLTTFTDYWGSGTGNVTVKFVNPGDATNQSALTFDDISVHSYAGGTNYRDVVTYTLNSPVSASNYYLTVIADSQGATDEDFVVEIDGNNDAIWLNIGTITGSAGYVTLNRGPGGASWGAETPTNGVPFRVRFTDQTQAGDLDQNTLSVDYIAMLCYESPNLRVGYEFTFSPVPTGTFDLHYDARFTDGNGENMDIFLYDFDASGWVDMGWDFAGNAAWDVSAQTRAGLGNQYISGTGQVWLRFEDTVNDETDDVQGTLDVDYCYVQTASAYSMEVIYQLNENDGDGRTTWGETTYTLYFQARDNGAGTDTLDVDYRVDGATWQNFGTISGGAWGGANDLSAVITPVNGEYVEIRVRDNGLDDGNQQLIEIDYIYLGGNTPAGGNALRADYIFDFVIVPPGSVGVWVNAYYDDADAGDDVWIWAYDFSGTSWVNTTEQVPNGALGLVSFSLGAQYVEDATGEVYIGFRNEPGNDNTNAGTLHLEYMNCSFSASSTDYDLNVMYTLGPVVNAANYDLYFYASANTDAGEDFTAVYRINGGGDNALAGITTTVDTATSLAVGALGAGDHVFINITDDGNDDLNQYAVRVDYIALVEQSASTPISNADCSLCHNATAHNPRYVSFAPFNATYGEDSMERGFCDQTCHNPADDGVYAGPADHASVLATVAADASLHKTSDILDVGGNQQYWTDLGSPADGSVECTDCHSDDHVVSRTCLDWPECHNVTGANNWDGAVKKTIGSFLIQDHSGYGAYTNAQCSQAGCHENGVHDPEPAGGCHGTAGNCWDMDSMSHPKHIDDIFLVATPDYNYNCSDCHYNVAGTYQSTYGTGQHGDGTLQVQFDTTGLPTYSGVLAPTYNATSNWDCSGTYCHSNGFDIGGAGFVSATANWDQVGSVVCGDCHGNPPTTSSHAAHTDGSPYSFSCSVCHYDAAGGAGLGTYQTINHANGTVEVNFQPNSLADNAGDPNYSPTWTDPDCSEVYCHDPTWDGATTQDGNAADVVPTWGGAVACGDCHGDYNPAIGGDTEPTTNSHQRHVDDDAIDGVASGNQYNFDCGECHWDTAENPSDTDGTYGGASNWHVNGAVDVNLDNTVNGLASDSASGSFPNPDWNGGTSTCGGVNNLYCHNPSDGADNNAADTSPTWGGATNCGDCHGDYNAAIGGDTEPTTSSHQRHVDDDAVDGVASGNQYNFDCGECHWDTAENPSNADGTYAGATGWHVNGAVDVNLDNTANGAASEGASGSFPNPDWNSGTSTCGGTNNLYCHNPSGGADGNAADTSPTWGVAVACGDCHGDYNAALAGNTEPTSSSHDVHVDDDATGNQYNFDCGECHWDTAENPSNTDGTYAGASGWHVNVQVDVNLDTTANGAATNYGDAAFTGVWNGVTSECSDIWCHDPTDGVDGNAADPTPIWGAAGACGDCHGSNVGGSKPTTGNHPEHAETESYRCGECHWDSVAGAPSADGTYGTTDHVDIAVDTTWWDNAGAGFPPGLQTNAEWSWTQVAYAGGTCDVYCHDPTTDDDATITTWTPGWGDATVAACDDCHGGETTDTDTIDTGSHPTHVTTQGYACSVCHDQTGTYLPGDNAFSHVDGQVNFNYAGDLDLYSDTPLYADGAGSMAPYGSCDVNDANCHPDGRIWGAGCHGEGGNCWNMATGSHDTHINATWLWVQTYPNTYNCSTCHYNAAGTYQSTYGTGQHADGVEQVFTANGGAVKAADLDTRWGNDGNSPNWLDPDLGGNGTCEYVYCHSNGVSADGEPAPTVDGWGGVVDEAVEYYWPQWGTTFGDCGGCHPGQVLGAITASTDYPNTGEHRKGAHNSNSQGLAVGSGGQEWSDGFVQCFWCHTTNDDNTATAYQGTFGTAQHLNGAVEFNPRNYGVGTMDSDVGYEFNSHCGPGGGGTKTCWY